jgi:hypothetical protein
MFAGGVLVEEKPWDHAVAVARTPALMADHSVPAIEAAFEHSGVAIRVDVPETFCRGVIGECARDGRPCGHAAKVADPVHLITRYLGAGTIVAVSSE